MPNYNPQELQQKYEQWCKLHRQQLEAQQQFLRASMLLPMRLHLLRQRGDIGRVLVKITDDVQAGDVALLGAPALCADVHAGCGGA